LSDPDGKVCFEETFDTLFEEVFDKCPRSRLQS